ncbi:MAG: VIT1/CCC1 transporter family protein [Patescibacteria group bacterium]
MNSAIKKGFGFGLTSGVITTLGMIVGLQAGTGSKTVVLGGIFIIALADALSDALGTHISEESEDQHSNKEIWQATFATFVAKLIVALTFVAPVLLFSLTTAIWISIVWGLSLIIIFSYLISRAQGLKSAAYVVFEHLIIAVFVIIATHYIGDWVNKIFV